VRYQFCHKKLDTVRVVAYLGIPHLSLERLYDKITKVTLPTRDDGDINPNTKVYDASQRGRKIGRPGKEDGEMANIPRI
jgi:hypothetical protein